ncbi:MAG: ABC transporter ATP-binding protein [Candidatus Tectimicrobiota bacterium]
MLPALAMHGITKRFPGVLANDNIDLQIAAGEIHALLGENGAGKSTLMHMLAGLSQPDAGEIRLHGRVVRLAGPREALAHGIGMVHQHCMLVPTLTVTENIVLGHESSGRWPLFSLRRAERQIRHLAQQYHLEVDPQALVRDLPVGVRQRVEILKVLYRQARIIILDEPTAVLTAEESRHLGATLTALAHSGAAIVFITHKLSEVFQIAQRLTVLRQGRVVATLTPAETTMEQLAALMVGGAAPPLSLPVSTTPPGQAVLRVHDLQVRDDRGVLAVAGVSLTLHAGEILALAGVQGNGQTELVQALTGLRRPARGHVSLRDVDITAATPRQLLALGVAHIPEDRQAYGMVASYSVADNLVLHAYGQAPFARYLMRQESAIQARAVQLMQDFDIRAASPSIPAGQLSGGNQQKMVLARECSRCVTLLIAVHPTRGLDIAATAAIHQRLLQQRGRGCAILLVSADLDEALALSDRLAVMYQGRLLALLPTRQTRREQLAPLLAGLLPSRRA